MGVVYDEWRKLLIFYSHLLTNCLHGKVAMAAMSD